MSNVEYRCSHTNESGNRDCGNKLFALPGGTKLRCRHHDVPFVQTEEGRGPDFLFVDEEGKTKSKDAIVGEEKIRVAREDEVKGEVADLAPTGEQVILRGVYQSLTGNIPDLRWGPARLRDEIEEWKTSMVEGNNTPMQPDENSTGEANEQEGHTVDNVNDEVKGEGKVESDEEEQGEPTLENVGPGEIVDGIPD